jgi:hypothetical protein
MRLETVTIPAHKVEVDSFIYLPKKGLWMFVDDLVQEDNQVTFISEIWENMFDEKTFTVSRYSKIKVLKENHVYPENYDKLEEQLMKKANVENPYVMIIATDYGNFRNRVYLEIVPEEDEAYKFHLAKLTETIGEPVLVLGLIHFDYKESAEKARMKLLCEQSHTMYCGKWIFGITMKEAVDAICPENREKWKYNTDDGGLKREHKNAEGITKITPQCHVAYGEVYDFVKNYKHPAFNRTPTVYKKDQALI